MTRTYDAIICGAGIAGVSAAVHLQKAGIRRILLVDDHSPLSFTSDHSTECYRNWWPDVHMLAFMNRSIDLMEELAAETGNVFRMNRRGYLYVTADAEHLPVFQERALRTSSLGAGPLRIHSTGTSSYTPARPEGFEESPDGADLLLDPALIRTHFPYLTSDAVAALHVRRAGWLSAQQLGMSLFETARSRGAEFESGRVQAVEVEQTRVRGVRLSSGEGLDSPVFVNAAGPYLNEVAALLDAEIPVYTELHMKASVNDGLRVVGREAPLLIWADEQVLPWQADEREALGEDPETSLLTSALPGGAHTRPEGGAASQAILMLWEYRTRVVPAVWPPALDEHYPEVAMRGLATMLPRMREYFQRMPRPQLDGGYYTKTRDNLPLIGPCGAQGAYVIGALSGYGIMAACAAGELAAAHIAGGTLPAYAGAFGLLRFTQPEYQNRVDNSEDTGQL